LRLTAEEVVSGSFKIVGGTITEINATAGEIKISDLQTKKPLTIMVKSDSVIRRFPQGGPMMMGGGAPGQGQGQAAQGGGAQGQQRPQGGGAGGPQGPPGNGQRPGGGGMSMADMLERLPTISVNDLKVGDTIIMSTTQSANPERLTAISMVAGAEQILAMMAARQQQAGGPARPSSDLNSNFGGMFGGVGLP
jgi:hypothetical protein